MPAKYTYQESSPYINTVAFEYIETYSFQRDEGYLAQRQKDIAEYFKLQDQQRTRELTGAETEKFCKLKPNTQLAYIIVKDGKFHPSSEKKSTFKKGEKEVDQLLSILNTPATDVPAWMCAPMYRDAIIFYDAKGDIVSALNICFSCQYMEIAPFSHINADVSVYQNLKMLLLAVGHDIKEH